MHDLHSPCTVFTEFNPNRKVKVSEQIELERVERIAGIEIERVASEMSYCCERVIDLEFDLRGQGQRSYG